jgi:hypothetical protein
MSQILPGSNECSNARFICVFLLSIYRCKLLQGQFHRLHRLHLYLCLILVHLHLWHLGQLLLYWYCDSKRHHRQNMNHRHGPGGDDQAPAGAGGLVGDWPCSRSRGAGRGSQPLAGAVARSPWVPLAPAAGTGATGPVAPKGLPSHRSGPAQPLGGAWARQAVRVGRSQASGAAFAGQGKAPTTGR